MTTNVFCKRNNQLASDSRWSYRAVDDNIRAAFAIAYVDDTGFEKIAFDEDTGYIFAGPLPVIAKWRDWVINPNQPVMKRPDVAPDFAICMTDLATGDILMEHGQKVADEWCRTAGTGAKHAYDCWVANQDARRAVETAKLLDVLSGGEVKYLMGGPKKVHNFDFSVPPEKVAEVFLKKGMVMYPATTKGPIPIGQAANDDPRIAQLVKKVQDGQVQAEAPSGYDPVVWTPTDEQRLDEALARRAEKRRQGTT